MSQDFIFSERTFTAWDYVVFAILLVLSSVIGLYFAFVSRKKPATTDDYLMAGRSMGVWPVALSLLASFMSAITLLGTPAEIALFGSQYWMIGIAYCLVIPLTNYVFMPVFYNLNLTSVFEYLEWRFSKGVRVYACIVFICQTTFYLSMVLFAPCLALSIVTGLNKWIAVVAVGVVCTFYTTIGGMKAVMWTNVVQIFLMFAGLIVIIVKGAIDHGGMTELWMNMYHADRIEFFNFSPDPRVRHSFWSIIIGGTFTWLAIYGVNQTQIQRALCTPTLKKAQIAMWINLVGLVLLLSVCCLCGFVLFSEYRCCDPLNKAVGRITGKDQYLALYVMDRLYYPGFPGFFTACIFSGGLSTISSGLNSLAAVVQQDLLTGVAFTKLSPARQTLIAKLLSIGFGVIVTALTVLADQLTGLLEAALAIFGMIGGPILGLFILGIIYPWANKYGAYVGTTLGLVLTLWLGVGGQIYKPPVKGHVPPPMVITSCPLNSSYYYDMTTSVVMTTNPSFTLLDESLCSLDNSTYSPNNEMKAGYISFYQISYLWYSAFAVFVTTVSGLIVSFMTGYTRPRDVNPALLCPVFNIFKCCLPLSVRRFLLCYIDFDQIESLKQDGSYYGRLEDRIRRFFVECQSKEEKRTDGEMKSSAPIKDSCYIYDTDIVVESGSDRT